MKRAVITGMGIVSSIGSNKTEVLDSLKNGKSGIKHHQEYADLGLRTALHGNIDIPLADLIDRKVKRFMGDAAAYTYVAMKEAIADAGLDEALISNPRIGLIAGSGGASTANVVLATDKLREKGIRRVGPYMVTKTMSSTVPACLATPYKIKGINYAISSACATSAHCIGNASELIQLGKQDIIFAGGGEEIDWTLTMLFDAMGALSSKYNDSPETASRPYDATRDGFVISGGGGMLVVEELEHAQKRGARIYAEVTGYGATSDGYDMVQPSGEGGVRCMQMAMQNIEGDIDYINAHGTSTPAGDIKEIEAVKAVFGDKIPRISATKSISGHALGAAGVHEAIYSLLMMEHHFIAASANITQLDPAAEGIPIVTKRQDNVNLNHVLSNSFGFGGTNACLVLSKFKK